MAQWHIWAISVIYERLIPISKVRDLLIVADNAGLKNCGRKERQALCEFQRYRKWSYITNYEITDFKSLNIEAEIIYVVADSPQVIDLVKNHLHNGLHLYVSRNHLAMMMHEEAQNPKRVAALAEHWDINVSEIVAFGDDTNDINLLKHCGIGAAVSNALDEVKKQPIISVIPMKMMVLRSG